MRTTAVETATTLRRLVRRRTVLAVAALDLLVVLYGAFADRVPSARAAVSEASALAALTVLVLSAGIVSDDLVAGRLALAGTHPSRRAGWALGRWLAVFGAATAVLTAGAAVLLTAADGPLDPWRAAAAWGAGVAYTAALAALAVALSCRAGATPQGLLLVSLLVVGAMPPEVVTHALGAGWTAVARAAWTLLPTPWALGRLHAWAWEAGTPAPLAGLALPAEAALWLLCATRLLGRAELGARGP